MMEQERLYRSSVASCDPSQIRAWLLLPFPACLGSAWARGKSGSWSALVRWVEARSSATPSRRVPSSFPWASSVIHAAQYTTLSPIMLLLRLDASVRRAASSQDALSQRPSSPFRSHPRSDLPSSPSVLRSSKKDGLTPCCTERPPPSASAASRPSAWPRLRASVGLPWARSTSGVLRARWRAGVPGAGRGCEASVGWLYGRVEGGDRREQDWLDVGPGVAGGQGKGLKGIGRVEIGCLRLSADGQPARAYGLHVHLQPFHGR